MDDNKDTCLYIISSDSIFICWVYPFCLALMKKYTTIDEYLTDQPKEYRVVLQKLRKYIKKIVPKSEESISYSMPAFKFGGKTFAIIAGFKNHMSLFPYSGGITKSLKDELKDFITSKGTIQFTLDKPLPEALFKKVILTRLEEIAMKAKK